MVKIFILFTLFYSTIWGTEIPISEVEKRSFSKSITISSQVVQLSSSKSSLMARLGGRVIQYHIREGEKIKANQLIATIESLELTSLSAKLEGLEKERTISEKNYAITQKLYKVGAESLHNLNLQEEEKNRINSQIVSIKSKLSLVNSKDKNIYSLYAKTDGRINAILAPLNSVVNANEPLVEISKGSQSFLIKSFIPLKYAQNINIGQKGEILYGDKYYPMKVIQILPKIDIKTQQITIVSSLEKPVSNLFVNTFLESKLFLKQDKEYLSIKKSALAFFNNEWVVFVPKIEHKEHHDEDKDHDAEHHDDKDHEEEHHDDKEHDADDGDDEHGHKHHEEKEIPYDIKVIKMLKQNENYVAIEGLVEHQKYVSGKSYYIKSMLLKSSLGGHGH